MKTTLTASFAALWLADTALTIKFVMEQGVEMEAHPVMRYVLSEWGYPEFVAVKLAVLLFWLMLANRVHWGIHAALNVMMIVIVCMGTIVAFNL